MEEKKNLMSYEKLRELEAERDERKEVIRAEIAQKIKEAREQGDLSENAEYDAAKVEQRENELRIEEIESILKNAEVYLEEDVAKDAVGLGSTVTLLDIEYNEDDVNEMIGHAFKEGNPLYPVPKEFNKEEFKKIYRVVLQ